MKTSYYYIALFSALLILLSGCEDENKKLEGSGIVTKEQRLVNEFSELYVDGIINVYLIKGSSQKVEVETDENLQHIVTTEIIDGVLKIDIIHGQDFDATKLNAYITTPSVNQIEMKGITNLQTKSTFRQNSLLIYKDNTGNLDFEGEIEYFRLENTGIGNTILRGKCTRAIINFGAIGNLEAYEFQAGKMELEKSGTGNAEIWVKDKLTLQMSGIGDVFCKGDPVEIEKEVDGLGQLYILVN